MRLDQPSRHQAEEVEAPLFFVRRLMRGPLLGNRGLSLIAGGGGLPLALAEHCRLIGRPYFVVRLRGFTDAALAMMNTPAGLFSNRYERVPADIHAFIKQWLTRGNPHVPWETEGYPGISPFRQIQSFWDFRDLPNVFMTHYDDLQTDFANEIRRIAKFVDIDPSDELIRTAERLCSFEAMKRDGAELMPGAVKALDGGAQRFFNKGVSGRWKDLFTADELELYDAAVRRSLAPDCARWLEQGRPALTSNKG